MNHLDDLAELAVEKGQKKKIVIINAIGPKTFTCSDLAAEIGKTITSRRPIIPVPPLKGFILGKIVGFFHRDVTITYDEIRRLLVDNTVHRFPSLSEDEINGVVEG